jgi:hypothetical protein
MFSEHALFSDFKTEDTVKEPWDSEAESIFFVLGQLCRNDEVLSPEPDCSVSFDHHILKINSIIADVDPAAWQTQSCSALKLVTL